MSDQINTSVIRFEGTQAERLAYPAQTGKNKKIIEWKEPDGSMFEQLSDGSWIQTSFGGAVGVVESFEYAVPSDREMGAISSRTSAAWTEAEDVTRITITAIGAVGESCAVCFDAPDDATAVSWLGGNVDTDGATMRRVVEVGVPREFVFANPLRRIDAIDFVGTVTNLFIEAGK